MEDIIITGRRGFRGYPNREQWADRLQAYREHLEEELKNVQELIERLGRATAKGEPEPRGGGGGGGGGSMGNSRTRRWWLRRGAARRAL